MGYFIAIDGLDGSGKKTQSELLVSYLKSRGLLVRKLDFPNYAGESSYFVKMYLNGELGTDPKATNAYAASMFFAADRYVSYRRDWSEDYLNKDTVIVADRYTTANAIHQLSKLPREDWDGFLSWLWDFEFTKLSLPSPDLVLFLEVPPALSHKLVALRSAETGRTQDIHELDPDHMTKSYDAAVFASGELGWKRISCEDPERALEMRSREDIFAEIKATVDEKLGL